MSVKLEVQGMSCAHCVAAITSAVQPLLGVSGVEVDLTGGVVTVAGAPDVEAVTAAIENAGYEVDRAA